MRVVYERIPVKCSSRLGRNLCYSSTGHFNDTYYVTLRQNDTRKSCHKQMENRRLRHPFYQTCQRKV